MIRPAALVTLLRWSEVLASVGVAGAGLWLARFGGWVLLPLGGAICALAAGYGLTAYRRMRFAQAPNAAGFVEVSEGQVAYFAGDEGGFLALSDLTQVQLVTLSRRRFWRLSQSDGQALLIPVDAAQNAALFDAFAALPQMDSAALVAALARPPETDSAMMTLWRRDRARSGPEGP